MDIRPPVALTLGDLLGVKRSEIAEARAALDSARALLKALDAEDAAARAGVRSPTE